MKRTEFEIGKDFTMSGKTWRCTDIGSRVVVAIEIDDREDQSWFSGPPYAVVEAVLDRHDQIACERLNPLVAGSK